VTDREARTFYLLTRHPHLWALMVLVGAVGLSGAVAECGQGALSAAGQAVLAPLNYTVRDLPTREDVLSLLLAVRVLAAWTDRHNQPGRTVPLKVIARALDVSLADAEYAVAVARRYGWQEGDRWQLLPTL